MTSATRLLCSAVLIILLAHVAQVLAESVPKHEWSKKYTLPEVIKEAKFHTRNGERESQVAPKFTMEQIVQIKKARQMAFTEDGKVMFVGTRDIEVKTPVYAVYLNRKSRGVRDGVQLYDIEVEKVLSITEPLLMPSGVAYDDSTDTLYVAVVEGIMRYENALQRLRDQPEKRLTGDKIFETPVLKTNSWKYLKLVKDKDGNKKLLFPIGSDCDVCETDLPHSTINMIDLDGKNHVALLRGVRNSVGFDVQPDTEGTLWFTDCAWDSDTEAPCDELNKMEDIFEKAKTMTNKTRPSYGFPYCSGKGDQNKKYEGVNCDDHVPAAYCLGTKVASLGMTFYDAAAYSMMPKELVGTGKTVSLIAERGSWGNDVLTGYGITTVDVSDTSEGSYQKFIDGIDDLSPRPRLNDIAVYAHDHGSLFISDDGRDAIYRVTYDYPPREEEDEDRGPGNDTSGSNPVRSGGSIMVAVAVCVASILALLFI